MGKISTIPTSFMDNQSAITLVKNPVFHKRSKYIDCIYMNVMSVIEVTNIRITSINIKNTNASIRPHVFVAQLMVANIKAQ
ncbi:hypothetical protein JTB14_022438 [Gonioctena quinquepunctata]|nr:hypothetical protein JTB14_022438 [Gonioctena quinquepunctata]